ncbi:hypothetical protein D3C79_629420 [compost metagenome]
MNCAVCGLRLKQSGSHAYCVCGFTIFVVSPEYIEASKAFIGMLVSNTKYPDAQSFGESVFRLVDMHLPKLQQHIEAIVNGQEEFINMMLTDIIPHAINLHIGPESHNLEEVPQDLECSCGSTDFTFDKTSIGKISCNSCGAKFQFKVLYNRFMPEFTCTQCGCNKANDDGMIFACDSCCTGHIKTSNGLMPL